MDSHANKQSTLPNPQSVVGRLAPTPSGALHLGNARTFLIAWLSARSQGGRVVLRMDDLDAPRVKPGYVEQAMADLRWLGLEWDGEPMFQSRRGDAYRAALETLRAAGRVYPCVCSRREVAAAARAPHEGEEGPVYPGTCRRRPRKEHSAQKRADQPPSWRFATDTGESRVEFEDALHGRCVFDAARQLGDFIVFRNDGIAAYQLATIVDDHAQGVTEVVRGDDLLTSAPRQLLLYRALGLTPPRFMHVPLVLDAAGQRMAKRRDSTRLAALREAGVPAAQVIGALAASCGWAAPGEQLMPAELIGRFDLAKLPRRPVRWDGFANSGFVTCNP
ncbi:MAG: tRNA glutamyl-Q(34) synthetase GluQRS [Verrucomicrobiae bacterium]|nr:tRNA glutamyl-Q(34) synthetase GluQRS [Verrucomicrobiae bacterium]